MGRSKKLGNVSRKKREGKRLSGRTINSFQIFFLFFFSFFYFYFFFPIIFSKTSYSYSSLSSPPPSHGLERGPFTAS